MQLPCIDHNLLVDQHFWPTTLEAARILSQRLLPRTDSSHVSASDDFGGSGVIEETPVKEIPASVQGSRGLSVAKSPARTSSEAPPKRCTTPNISHTVCVLTLFI